MKTISHLLKTDLLRFRAALIGFYLLLLVIVVVSLLPLSAPASDVAFGIGLAMQAIYLLVLVVHVVQADSPADDRAQWLSRPVSGAAMLTSKSLFMTLAVWLPMVLAQMPGWLRQGFSVRLMILATLETGLWVGGSTLLVAALAAVTRGKRGFVAFTALLPAGLVVLKLVPIGGAARPAIPVWVIDWRIAMLAPGLALLMLGTVVVAMQYLHRKRGLGSVVLLGGLLLMPFGLPRPDSLRDRPSRNPVPDAPAGFEIAAPPAGRTAFPLFGNLVGARGLAKDVSVFPIEMRATFSRDGAEPGTLTWTGHPHGHWRNESRDFYALPSIAALLPEGTRLRPAMSFDNPMEHQQAEWESDAARQRYPDGSVGRLEGECLFELTRAVPVGEMPLRPGAEVRFDGVRYRLATVNKRPDAWHIRLDVSYPKLLLNAEPGHAGWRRYYEYRSGALFVLHASAVREARAQRVRSSIRGNIPFRKIGARRVDIHFEPPRGAAAVPVDDVKLLVVRILPQGRYRHAFALDNHKLETRHDSHAYTQRQRKQAEADAQRTLRETTLPANPADEQIAAYVRHVLAPRGESAQNAQGMIRRKLMQAGPSAVPALLDEFPNDRMRAPIIYQVLLKRCTARDVPALREILRRDPGLARVFRQKKWGHHAEAIIKEQLAARTPDYPRAALMLAAQYHDPATYDDLAWHMVYGDNSEEDLFRELEKLSDFDSAGVLARAWERKRIAGRAYALRDVALARNLPGALEIVVRHARERGTGRKRLDDTERLMLTLVDYSGPKAKFPEWVMLNGPLLEFDTATKKYVLREP